MEVIHFICRYICAYVCTYVRICVSHAIPSVFPGKEKFPVDQVRIGPAYPSGSTYVYVCCIASSGRFPSGRGVPPLLPVPLIPSSAADCLFVECPEPKLAHLLCNAVPNCILQPKAQVLPTIKVCVSVCVCVCACVYACVRVVSHARRSVVHG